MSRELLQCARRRLLHPTPGRSEPGQQRCRAVNKISATELAFMRHEFGRCVHRNLPDSFVLNGAPVKALYMFREPPPNR